MSHEERLLNVLSELMHTRTYPPSPERDRYLRKLQRKLARLTA